MVMNAARAGESEPAPAAADGRLIGVCDSFEAETDQDREPGNALESLSFPVSSSGYRQACRPTTPLKTLKPCGGSGDGPAHFVAQRVNCVGGAPAGQRTLCMGRDPSRTVTMTLPRRDSMSSEDEVRNASTKFYAGLLRMLDGDSSLLKDSWSHDATVTTMHPIGGLQTGWDEVRGSFEGVAQLASGGHAELRDQRIQVGRRPCLRDRRREGRGDARRRTDRDRAARHQRLSPRSRRLEDRPSSHRHLAGDGGRAPAACSRPPDPHRRQPTRRP